MKREADQLRQNVRELVDELTAEGVDKKMPGNEFLVTNHRDRVVSIRLYLRQPDQAIGLPMNISSQQACELAAWLVVVAGLGEHMSTDEALDYFKRAHAEALGS